MSDVVGNEYRGVDWRMEPCRTRTWRCTSYDPKAGFYMETVDEPVSKTCVSERAIGRTFHKVRHQVTR